MSETINTKFLKINKCNMCPYVLIEQCVNDTRIDLCAKSNKELPRINPYTDLVGFYTYEIPNWCKL